MSKLLKEIKSFRDKKAQDFLQEGYKCQEELFLFCEFANEGLGKLLYSFGDLKEKEFFNSRLLKASYARRLFQIYLLNKNKENFEKNNYEMIYNLVHGFKKRSNYSLVRLNNLDRKIRTIYEDIFNSEENPNDYQSLFIPKFKKEKLKRISKKTLSEIDSLYSFCDYADHLNSEITNYFNLKDSSLFSKRQNREISFPRQILIYFIIENNLKELYKANKVNLTAELFNKDHSTMSHSHKVISGLIDFPSREGRIIKEIQTHL